MRADVVVDTGHRSDDGLATIRLFFDGIERRRLNLPFRDIYERFGPPPPIALDFLLLASTCYALDKSVPRSAGLDRWTREFDLSIPVSDVALWSTACQSLERAFSFLSGDSWRFTFQPSGGDWFQPPASRRRKATSDVLKRPDAVCLFSGGLDSLAGAIDLLAGDARRGLLLLGHYDPDFAGPKSQQERLFPALRDAYPGRVELYHVKIGQHPAGNSDETTLRSRSVIFIAAAIYAAHALGADVDVYAPENGVIAINVPLTPSRAGSCSTRTMHPYFLRELSAALRVVGLSNRLHTPYALFTKGECVANCADRALLASVAHLSVSCSHPTRKQHWVRKQAANCGYCVPCIFRRAALHHASDDLGTQYGIDVCGGEVTVADDNDSSCDLRAVAAFVARRPSPAEIARAIRAIASIENAEAHAQTVHRGLEEVRQLFRDKARGQVREQLRAVIR